MHSTVKLSVTADQCTQLSNGEKVKLRKVSTYCREKKKVLMILEICTTDPLVLMISELIKCLVRLEELQIQDFNFRHIELTDTSLGQSIMYYTLNCFLQQLI